MTSETLPSDLVGATEYVRNLVLRHPDKSQLSVESGVKYQRLMTFMKNPGSMLLSTDLQMLLTHFGIKLVPTVCEPSTKWWIHPQNPAFEYEVKPNGHPTGKIRPVATKAAAE